jgi:hypothetical protein
MREILSASASNGTNRANLACDDVFLAYADALD